jgi:hypothetical protein
MGRRLRVLLGLLSGLNSSLMAKRRAGRHREVQDRVRTLNSAGLKRFHNGKDELTISEFSAGAEVSSATTGAGGGSNVFTSVTGE